MHQQAALAYGRTAQATISPRELEAHLLLKAAAKLQSAKDGWDGATEILREALTYNRRLWTVLAEAATRDENPLPQAVKNNLGSLALFVFNRTLALEARPSPDALGALININRQIAAGLRGQG